MIIIETCPVCGHDLTDLVLTTYPPIPQKQCFSCGWSWTGKREEVVRVPFGGNSFAPDTTNCLNNNINDIAHMGNFKQSACVDCINNPKNGGSGNCNCTLGQLDITC